MRVSGDDSKDSFQYIDFQLAIRKWKLPETPPSAGFFASSRNTTQIMPLNTQS